MKSVNFDNYIKKKVEFKRILLEREVRRLPRTKPRDQEEISILIKLTEERQKRWLAEKNWRNLDLGDGE